MVLKKKDSLFLLNWVFSNLDVHLSRSCDMGFFINENSASKQKIENSASTRKIDSGWDAQRRKRQIQNVEFFATETREKAKKTLEIARISYK